MRSLTGHQHHPPCHPHSLCHPHSHPTKPSTSRLKHGDRVALHRQTFVLGLGSFWGHLGPFGTALAHFWPFLAVLWPPTGASRKSGGQTHGDRVALLRGPLHLRLGSFWGHLGAFWAVLAHFGLQGPIFGRF